MQQKALVTSPTSQNSNKPILVQIGDTLISQRMALLAIIVVSVGLRLASALFQGNAIDTLPGVWDQVSYDGLARRVMSGHGFSFGEQWWPATRANEPTAHWSYLYTLYLVVVYSLTNAQPIIARILQAILVGVLHPCWHGASASAPLVKLLNFALFSAVYVYFFYYGGALVTETMYITALFWMFDVALRLRERPFGNPYAGLNWVAIGVSALFRQLILLFVPFLFLWLWWRTGDIQFSTRPQKAVEGAMRI